MTKKQRRLRAAFAREQHAQREAREGAIMRKDIESFKHDVISKGSTKTNGKSFRRFNRDNQFESTVWIGKPLDSMRHPKGKTFVVERVKTWVNRFEQLKSEAINS